MPQRVLFIPHQYQQLIVKSCLETEYQLEWPCIAGSVPIVLTLVRVAADITPGHVLSVTFSLIIKTVRMEIPLG